MEQPTIELEYVNFLKENNLTEAQMPSEIRKQITVLKAHVGRYKKTPTESQKNTITKQDVTVCDLIADFIEEGINEEDEKEKELAEKKAEEERIAKQKAEEDEKAKKAAEEKEKNELPPKNTEEVKQTPPPAQYSPEAQRMMKEINEALENGKISKSKLQEIIQRKPAEPTQIVGSMKLRKVFLRNEYQLVN
ncbi:MAG: hypothetical protein PHT69_02235 [Bacteroidales bacterium]|nr:hypothetical protein [Bacteroidales bacterium]